MEQEFKYIKLENLKLDVDNPRLPHSLHGKGEKEIIDYMLLEGNLIELMLSIGENGYFAGEQLLVVEDESNNYVVVEGNRRLSAVKLLNDPSLAKVQKNRVGKVMEELVDKTFPKEIPCLIFETEQDINKYLGYKHITGIKEWKLLQKARYLYELKNTLFSDISQEQASRELAKIIGSRKSYVKRILVSFEIYKIIEDEAYFGVRGWNDTNFYFNYISDSLNKDNISSFLGVDMTDESITSDNINKDNLKKWTKWFFEKGQENKTRLIGDSYTLSNLNKVMEFPEALEKFENGMSLENALYFTNKQDEVFIQLVRQANKNLEEADDLVIHIDSNFSASIDMMKTIIDIARKIRRTLEDKEDDR